MIAETASGISQSGDLPSMILPGRGSEGRAMVTQNAMARCKGGPRVGEVSCPGPAS